MDLIIRQQNIVYSFFFSENGWQIRSGHPLCVPKTCKAFSRYKIRDLRVRVGSWYVVHTVNDRLELPRDWNADYCQEQFALNTLWISFSISSACKETEIIYLWLHAIEEKTWVLLFGVTFCVPKNPPDLLPVHGGQVGCAKSYCRKGEHTVHSFLFHTSPNLSCSLYWFGTSLFFNGILRSFALSCLCSELFSGACRAPDPTGVSGLCSVEVLAWDRVCSSWSLCCIWYINM